MSVPDLTCLALTVYKTLKGVRKFKYKSRDSSLLGINFSFLVSIDLINNCTKFEAGSFSHSEDTTWKPENVEFEENDRLILSE